MKPKFLQAIPAPQGSFFISEPFIFPVEMIVFWEYEGKIYDVPMWCGELSDSAKEKDQSLDIEIIIKEGRELKRCLTKNDVDRLFKSEHFNVEMLNGYLTYARTGEIECTREVAEWLESDSMDIRDCEDDNCE